MTKKLNRYFIVLILTAAVIFCPFYEAFALKEHNIPNLSKIKRMVIEYKESGEWAKEIEEQAKKALAIIEEHHNKYLKQAIIFDIDETALDNYAFYKNYDFGYNSEAWHKWMHENISPAVEANLEVYNKAIEKGITVFFITGRGEIKREATERNLKQVGYSNYKELILRAKEDLGVPAVKYKSGRRKEIESCGYEILLNIGDQHSDLDGGYSRFTIKYPNPIYFLK